MGARSVSVAILGAFAAAIKKGHLLQAIRQANLSEKV
jgi:hypothetical protein